MEVGLIGSYWGMRSFCYENGAFINAHDRAVSRDGKTKYRLLDREEDLEGREFSEAIMLDEHPDATDKEKERHKRIFRELYKTHRQVEFVINYRIRRSKMDEEENYFEQAKNGKMWCYDCEHYSESCFCGFNNPKCGIYGEFICPDNHIHPDTSADTCEHYKQKDGERWFEIAERKEQEIEFVTNFCNLIASTELYLPEDIGESAEQMAKRLFEDGWRISRSKGYLKII